MLLSLALLLIIILRCKKSVPKVEPKFYFKLHLGGPGGDGSGDDSDAGYSSGTDRRKDLNGKPLVSYKSLARM
jgi:hypothetical protein